MNIQEFIQKRRTVVLFVIIVIGLALRLVNLDMPLWGDETASWAFARRTPFLEMWKFASHDPTPPLYYAVLHFTMSVLGESAVGLRLPSVFLGVSLIPLTYWSMRQAFFQIEDSLYAALLVATSSMLIYYSQEARAYAMLAFFGTLSVGLLFRSLRNSTLTNELLYGFTILVVSYTHGYGYFLIMAQLVSIVFYKKWRMLLIASSIYALALILLVVQILDASFGYGPSGDIITAQNTYSLVNTLNAGTVGLQSNTKMANGHALKYPVPVINQILPLLGLLVFSVIFLNGLVNYKKYIPTQRQYMSIAIIALVCPIFLAVLSGSPISPKPQWLLRGLIFIWPLYYMVAVAAISKSNYKIGLITLVVIINCFSLYPYYTTYQRFWDIAAFEQLSRQATSDDLIISDPWYMHNFIDYLYNGKARMIGFDSKKGWIDVERIQNNNEMPVFPLSDLPHIDGRIYVFYRKENIAWSDDFPDHVILVYDPAISSWREYRQTAE